MIDSRSLVPEVYTEDSRDYQMFLKLLDVMINPLRYLTYNLPKLVGPDSCPPRMLKLLGEYVGYEVDSNLSVDITRMIIKYYKLLVRNKGNRTGISMVVSLVLGIWNYTSANNYYVIDDSDLRTSGVIRIDVYTTEYNRILMNKLLEVVRPAGVRYEVASSTIATTKMKGTISDKVEVISRSPSTVQEFTDERIGTVSSTVTDDEEMNKEESSQ